MGYFGIPFRNGVPIGLGSVVGFGAPQEFSPSELFAGGTVAGAWYDPSDLSTLFTTSAGTTQCAMPGQGSAVSVGLMLDKSQNGVGTNGAYRYNLLTYTEQFDNAAWVKDGSTAANTTATTDPLGGNTADVLTATLALYAYTYQPTPVSTITATFSCYVKAATASVFWLYYESGVPNGVAYFGTDLTTQVVAGSSQTPSNLTITSVGNGWFRISAQWSTVAGSRNFGVGISDAKGSQAITIGRAGYIWGAQVASAAAPTAYQRIDANWYSAVPGNHAIAFNDTTARPELRARVNLLTYSEDFSNAVWTPTGVTVSTNTVVAPDGTTTADTITGDGAVSTHWLTQSNAALASGKTWSICAKAGTNNFIQLIFAGDADPWANFDLSGGVVGSTGTNVAATISALGNGWYRCTISTPSSLASSVFVALVNSASAPRNQSVALSTSVHLWGADLRPANIGANVPAYQRIADANTYDTSGFPLYLRFDGIDDSMYTPANLDLSGTDKVSVFAGVRKLSDAQNAAILESTVALEPRRYAVFAKVNIAGADRSYAFVAGSSAENNVTWDLNLYPAPITNVLSCAMSSVATLGVGALTPRINGVQVAPSTATTNTSTGNFPSTNLYIGSRGNSSLWFNGHLYSLAVVGSAVSAGNISATEQWVAQKTGLVIP